MNAATRPRHQADVHPLARASSGSGGDRALRAGDVILFHSDHWHSRLIQATQRLRYPYRAGVPHSRCCSYWNHVAIALSAGTITEALWDGVRSRAFHDGEASNHRLIRLDLSEKDRREITAFARSCTGERYGFLTLVAVLLNLLTPSRLTFGLDGTETCSGLVARALERAGYIWPRNPAAVMPADIAHLLLLEPLCRQP